MWRKEYVLFIISKFDYTFCYDYCWIYFNTPTSRKSKEHWEYAQSIAPNIFINYGKILVIVEIFLSIILPLFNVSINNTVLVGIILGFIFLSFSFYKTENKIKKRFMNSKS